MVLIVNSEKVDDALIIEEIKKMRPDYERVFQDQSPDEREAQLLDWAKETIVERILIRQAAQKDSRKVSQKSVSEAFQKLKKEQGGEKAFYKNLGFTKKDDDRIRKDIETQLCVERLIEETTGSIPLPADSDLKTYYEEHHHEFKKPEQVHAAHIVKHVDGSTSLEAARESILGIQQRLEAGESYEKITDSISDCPGNGGDLGWFPRGQMVQAFDDVVFSMEAGQVSDMFQTEFGFHIAKVYERRPESAAEFYTVKEEITKKVVEAAKNKKLEMVVDDLKEQSNISFAVDDAFALNLERVRAEADRKRYPKPLNSLLVKPAGPDCNMACTYCFYLEKGALFPGQTLHRMTETILEEMVRQTMIQAGSHISFGWQGGEPTLMGLDFFKKAVAFQKKYGSGQTIGNGLQTNGLLIDDSWITFLKDNHFLVGLSLDGPEPVHDRYRRNRGGEGTWRKVKECAEHMLKAGVAVNALSVVNAYSVRFPEEIYRFHQGLGFDFMQFIPCVEADPKHPGKTAPFSVSPEAYGQFLCKIFDFWTGDFTDGVPTTSVRFFDAVFFSYVGQKPPECTLEEECGVYVVVEHNGNVYACDFFVEPEWKLGNVMESRLIDMLNASSQNAFGRKKTNLPSDCIDCRWLQLCRGGCTKDRLHNPADRNRTYFCKSYQMFFAHADGRFKQLAEEWKKKNIRAENRDASVRTHPTRKRNANRNDPCPCGSGRKFKKCCGRDDKSPTRGDKSQKIYL